MGRKPNESTFLNDAERVIREYASKNTELVVWRGKYGRKLFDSVYTHETIIAGLSDEPDSVKPPGIAILKVWFDILAEIEFMDGGNISSSLSYVEGHFLY